MCSVTCACLKLELLQTGLCMFACVALVVHFVAARTAACTTRRPRIGQWLSPACVMLAALLLQHIELLTTFVEKPQFQGQVQAALKEMMYVSIAYLQMTQVRAMLAPGTLLQYAHSCHALKAGLPCIVVISLRTCTAASVVVGRATRWLNCFEQYQAVVAGLD